MPQSKLPVKLGKEPLLDVVFEVRFKSTSNPTEVLPGLLFSTLSTDGGLKVSRLPVADLPSPIRRNDPNLRFAPLVRVEWLNYSILIGDELLAVACKLPYPGWAAFRSAISRITSLVLRPELVKTVERYSLKYVDLIPRGSLRDQLACFNWSIRVGHREVDQELINLRVERVDDGVIHAITMLTGAQATVADGSQAKKGAIIDIDSIVNVPSMLPDAFLANLDDRLDRLHSANKSVFFECVSADALTSLEPVYD